LKPQAEKPVFDDFEVVVAVRKGEADHFYAELQRGVSNADQRLVQRQAFAGMIWSKQFYHIDVARWLDGDPAQTAANTDATTNGVISTMPTSCPCRTNGSTRGTQHGTWHFIASRWR
jgi:hypothetical protein